MDTLSKGVASLLRELRTKRNMTQDELAELIGVQRTSVSNIEKAKQNLSLELFCRICLALDENPNVVLRKALISQGVITVSEQEVANDQIRKAIEEAINK